MEPAAVVLSAVHVPRESAQICTPAQKCTLPEGRDKGGKFVARAPLCDPATPEQYATAKAMMIQGKGYKAIIEATGTTWAALAERGYLQPDKTDFGQLQRAWRIAQAGRVIDKALRVANQDDPAERTSTTDPAGGVTSMERYKTDPSTVSAVLAGLMPEVHGKGAGRQTPQINVAGNAQIFGGAPTPGSLDDFDAL